jgi:hypothetical protein
MRFFPNNTLRSKRSPFPTPTAKVLTKKQAYDVIGMEKIQKKIKEELS